MKCLKCEEFIDNSIQCHNCQTNQEEFLFENLEKLTLDQILTFIFQSNLFDRNSNSIKAALNDLLIYKKKEKNIIELLLNDDLLDRVLNTTSLEQAERLVIIVTKNLVDTFEINEELIYNITRSFVQAIKPEFTIREYIKNDHISKPIEKPSNKPKFKFIMLVVVLTIVASTSLKVLLNKDEMVSITFKYDDGTIIEEYSAEAGNEVNIPIADSKEGFTFIGWYDGETFMEDVGDVLEVPSSNRVFTAVYKEYNDKTIRVVFVDFNGDILLEDFYNENDKITNIPIGVREGYDFSGWFNGDTMLPSETKSITVPNYDITFTAVYVNKDTTAYSITYKYLDGRIIEQYFALEGVSMDIPVPEYREGYIFIGWYGQTFTRKGVGQLETPPFDEVFTAVYEPIYNGNPSLNDIHDKLMSGPINILGSRDFINEVSKYTVPGETCSGLCSIDTYKGNVILQLSEDLTEDERFILNYYIPSITIQNILKQQYIYIEVHGSRFLAIRGTDEYAISVIKDVFENVSNDNTLTLADIYDKLSKSNEGSFNIVGSSGFINEVSQYIVPGLTCTESCSPDIYSGHLLIQLSDDLTEEEQYALDYIIPPIAIKSINNQQYLSIEDNGRFIIAIRGSEEYTIDIIKEVFNLE